MKLTNLLQRWQQRRFLPDSVVLDETTSIKPALWTILTVLVIAIALLIWANFAYIQETHSAFGVVQPKQRIPVSQQLSKARIQRVLVNDGDIVKKGQPLIELSKNAVEYQLKNLQLQEITLAISAIRWQSFIDNGKTNLDAEANKLIKADYSNFSDQNRLNALITNQVQQLAVQNQQRIDQIAYANAVLKRYQTQAKQLTRQQQLLESNLDLQTKQLNMYKQLLKTNAISRRDYINMQRQVNTAQSNLSDLSSKQAELDQNLTQAKANIDELKVKIKQQALQSLSDINNQLSTLRSTIKQNNNAVNALNISAPVSGIVKDLSVSTGNTINAGQILLEIIPLERQLIVNANIPANEINRVSIGDSVRIKPLNNSSKFMTMSGEVQSISNNSFTDQTGQSYYRAIISVAQNNTTLNDEQALIPGMNVETYIATGKRSVLAYLLKPR